MVVHEHGESTVCLNCGHAVDGRFCANCGQNARNLRLSFFSLVSEGFSEIFTLDSKLLCSLKPLFSKPGLLTASFVAGKRVRYISPVRMYLFSSILFFLSFAVMTSNTSMVVTADGGVVTAAKNGQGRNTRFTLDTGSLGSGGDETQENGQDGEAGEASFFQSLQQRLEANADRMENLTPEEAVNRFVPMLMRHISNLLFLMLPLFALILKLLYFRRDPLYIDHLIFAFHYHSFLFLFYSLLIWWNQLMDADLGGVTALSVLFLTPWYLFCSMRRVYGQGILKTLIKFTVLWGSYFAIMCILLVAGALVTIYFFY